MNTKLNDVRLSLDGVRLSPNLTSSSEAALSHSSKLDGVRLSPNLTSSSEAALSHSSKLDGVRLSPHFMLKEFLKLSNYPDNIPTMQVVANLTYGCHQLLEPARLVAGPIIVNSGYRNEVVNRMVGGVKNSQHLLGQAADIKPKDPRMFHELVEFLRSWEFTDQLLTGNGWLHISWNPFAAPRHYVRIGYYH